MSLTEKKLLQQSQLWMTFAKMSAKLVVHKFVSGVSFKSLHVTIVHGDNGLSETRYSEWSEGKTQQKKRDAEKSSRLVVKIVSGDEINNFNLDSCAKMVDNSEIYLNNSLNTVALNDYKFNLANDNNCIGMSSSNTALYNQKKKDYHLDDYSKFNCEENIRRGAHFFSNQPSIYKQDIAENSKIYSLGSNMTPLEYSLEKVKENNARIMENIHMLNRTLNYTKKKEILDIVCPKSMRYSCNACGKCFVYETGLKRHYSMRHAMLELQPRWQVVWTCTECFQVWPQQDLAMKHSNQCCKPENTDCVREIKTSSLLQCEFCEKVYTSIPRLLRHSKIHTTANNYKCNACESTFISYKLAEQHWLLCPWLKLCYNFSLPKMLLCNQCDRKFKNYEQLYNHRYKVGHFMMKTHCNKGSDKTLGILVYQCEICGQWYLSILLLQAHRSQHHSGYDFGMQNKIEYNNVFFEAAESEHHMNHMDNIDN